MTQSLNNKHLIFLAKYAVLHVNTGITVPVDNRDFGDVSKQNVFFFTKLEYNNNVEQFALTEE
jgi:hypothetical protein